MRLNKGKPAGRGLMIFMIALSLASSLASVVWARPKEAVPQDNKIWDWRPLQKNNFFHAITNYGVLGQVKGGGAAYAFWPAPAIDADSQIVPPAMNYIFGWGLWIGAQVRSTKPGKTRDTLTTVGYNPNNATGEYTAGAVIGGAPQSVSAADVKIYSSLEAGWPLKTTGGKDSVMSVEDTRAAYNDYALLKHATGGRPLKVEVTQTTYQWNYPTNQDIIFFLFEVKNTGPDTLFDVYLAPTADCDIGNEAGTNANDVCYYDVTTNMGYQYQVSKTEVGWTRDAGCVGFMFMESPIANKSFTSPNGDFHIDIGDTIGLYAFKTFNIAVDPPDDITQYQELAGYNYLTGDFKRLDPKPSPGDCRFMESTGPIDMAPGSTAKTIVAVICANFDYSYLNVNDTLAIADLRAKAKSAKTIYDANWLLPGPPPAPALTITPGHHRAIIGWDNSSEIEANPKNKNLLYAQKVTRDSSTLAKFDPNFLTNIFQGYKLYKSDDGSTWKLLAQWDKDDRYVVDSIGMIVTGPETLKAAQWVPSDSTYRSVVLNPIWINLGADSTFNWKTPAFLTDTRGSNSGLQYSYVDENLINGFTYYYSVRAYGINWQSDLNDAKDSIISKSPAYYETAISENATAAVPRSEPNEYLAPQGYVTSYAGKAYNLSQKIAVTIDLPRAVKNGTFKQIWGPVTRSSGKDNSSSPAYYPVLSYLVTDQDGDTVVMPTPSTMLFDTVRGVARWLKSVKYTPGNYITIINDILVNKSGFAIKSIVPSASYTDTASVALITNPDMRWGFRNGTLEIRWTVTGTSPSDTLWPQVWHVVDSAQNIVVQVPYDSTKLNDCVSSSWNLGGTGTRKGRMYITSDTSVSDTANSWTSSKFARQYINLCGVRLYFNRGPASTTRMMTWGANKPANGDIWRLRTTGSTVPVEGEYQVITTSEYQFTSSVADLKKIKVIPNPYIARNIWERTNDRNKLQFTNLPSKCTVKIYTLAGNLIKVLEHDDNAGRDGGTCWWDPMLTMNQQQLASGVYLYYVDAPGIGTHVGKFAVVR
ncbi:hypothetical protein HY768_08000 [candidate division TA06 bacterium]|uniref:T9SS type A sorting domain-containing protein n=1 Tax=candidate division TA06 bacterium TaxID=2250710 RepID=A0A933I9N4_UNCT6|nr:hypothetical protein [candidate division TA06 bacterium]